MSAAETLYTARIDGPDYLERARAQTVRLSLYRDGALVAPTQAGSTFSLIDPSGTAVINAQAVTVTASSATYPILSTDIPATRSLGENWREKWNLVLPDGTTRPFYRDAVLVRSVLYPVITLADLARRHTDLAQLLVGSNDQYAQGYIDEAWSVITTRLESQGVRTHVIMTPWSLREVHLLKALELWATDAHTSMMGGDGKYLGLAVEYGRQFEQAWSRLNFRVDNDQDGIADGDDREGAAGVAFLCDPPRWR